MSENGSALSYGRHARREDGPGGASTGSPAPRAHLYYLDVLRILCILLVMFNHTAAFTQFTSTRGYPLYFPYIAVACLDKIAVPIFFMMSGALLLGREEPVRTVLTKRVPRMVVALLVASLVFYLRSHWLAGTLPEGFSLRELALGIWQRSIGVPLWYLYAYITFLLTLPLLRRLAQHLTEGEWALLACLYVAGQLLPIADFLLDPRGGVVHTSDLSFFLNSHKVFFPLLGYYLGRVAGVERLRRWLPAMLAAAVAAIAVECALTNAYCTITDTWDTQGCQKFLQTLAVFPVAAVFSLVRIWLDGREPLVAGAGDSGAPRWRLGPRAAKVLPTLGAATFGVYLFEGIYRSITSSVYDTLLPFLHKLPATCVWMLAAWALGTAVTLVLRRLPGLRKIL